MSFRTKTAYPDQSTGKHRVALRALLEFCRIRMENFFDGLVLVTEDVINQFRALRYFLVIASCSAVSAHSKALRATISSASEPLLSAEATMQAFVLPGTIVSPSSFIAVFAS